MSTTRQTIRKPVDFVLLPFKAYLVLVLLLTVVFNKSLRTADGVIPWLLLGWACCCIALFIGLIAQILRGDRAGAIRSVGFAALAVLAAWRLLPLLAR